MSKTEIQITGLPLTEEIQITGLPLTEDIKKTTLLFVRNPEDGTGDKRTTLESVERKLGSSSVFGFTASVADINKIELTNSNGGFEIESYKNGMIVSFISPLTSTGVVSINIGALPDKELKIINTTDSAVLTQNEYIEAIYIGDALTGKFYRTNSKTKVNQISDLTEVSTFTSGDFIAVHKNGATDDNKLSKDNLVKELGNSAVYGFNASSPAANKITLVQANGGAPIDAYKEDMIVKFISPITTTALTTIKVGGLAEINLRKLNTTDYAPVTQNTVIEAIYKGGFFYRTNVTEATIFTNEYVATASINSQNTLTTYTLTSAAGIAKSQYYNCMSILFTSPIDSKGAIVVNVDGLGLKPLTDPDSDGIGFDIYKDQAILGIYNGTKFIRHIFSAVEPEAPQPDPNVPVVPTTITVGAGEHYTDLQKAIDDLIRQFGESGTNHTATINLKAGYPIGSTVRISKNTPWITIVGNTTTPTQISGYFQYSGNGNITISGKWHNTTPTMFQFTNDNNLQTLTLKDASISVAYNIVQTNITYVNISAVNCTFTSINSTMRFIYNNPTDLRGTVFFSGCTFNNVENYIYNSGTTTVENCTFTGSSYQIFMSGTVNIKNINAPSASNGVLYFDNGCKATIKGSTNKVYVTVNNFHAITCKSRSVLTIEQGDFRGAYSITYPDIFCQNQGSIIYINPGVLGTTQASNGGQIVT